MTSTRANHDRVAFVQQCIVTAQQMQAIEARVFEGGLPVAALMDKVGGLIARQIQQMYPITLVNQVGVLVGPGHNGGDALVVARELAEAGYGVIRHEPFSRHKDLTTAHRRFADHVGIPVAADLTELQSCHLIIDGLFGFGLTRPIEGAIAHVVDQVNQWPIPVVSIDLPSGLDTDTGQVLGTAIHATHTLCLGLWKRSLLQDQALDCIGNAELIDFGLPLTDIQAILGTIPTHRRITTPSALSALPLPRPKTTYKYKEGHLLLVCGSHTYSGAAILAGLAARASGVGMLTLAVPHSLADRLVSLLPDALVVGCAETDDGAIAHLPERFRVEVSSHNRYSAIACGPGMTTHAAEAIHQLLPCPCPLILDADGLNILAQMNPTSTLTQRSAPTVLTPHPGEFKRLFPDLASNRDNRMAVAQYAAQQSQATIILKGARTVVAAPNGTVWVNPESTAALARGGSGDVLTGLLGGLMAQAVTQHLSLDAIIPSAVWWHAQGAIAAAQENTELGVDASTLITYLTPTLNQFVSHG